MQRAEKIRIIRALSILQVMHKSGITVFSIFLILLLWSCANQTTPTGGPKDERPPKLLKSIPHHKQKNYKDNTIQLTFDEFVNLNNAKDEILISPIISEEPTFKVKKNIVTITSPKGWEENTTYSISFREGIRDITENNPPVNLKLAFSTGSLIDSMMIKGRTKLALRTKIPEKITIALYQADTFNIFEHTPNYFTFNNDKGQFSLENIKDGKYYLYAFEDKNKNLKVESRTEKFGFLANPINLQGPVDSLTVPLVNLDMRPLSLNSIRNNGLFTRLKFNKYVTDFTVTSSGSIRTTNVFGTDQTEVVIYNPKNIIDSVEFSLSAIDSIGLKIDTTFFIKELPQSFIPDDFTVKQSPIKYDVETNELSQFYVFSKPLLSINYDSLFIQTDSTLSIPITSADVTYDSTFKKLYLSKNIHPDSLFRKAPSIIDSKLEGDSIPIVKKSNSSKKFQPSLLVNKSGFISIEGDTLKNQSFSINELNKAQTGILLIEVKTIETNFIIQLINAAGTVVREVRNEKKHTFNFLPPENYILQVIIDRNNNGKWDPGNFFKKEEPENIYFYQTQDKKFDVPIRANWELGPLMLIF